MIRLLAVDPGKENMGICIMDLDDKLNPLSIMCRTKHFTQENIDLKKTNDDVFMGLSFLITDYFFRLLCLYKPTVIIMEEPFVRMLTMHGSLTVVKALNSLDGAVSKYNSEVLNQPLDSDFRLKSIRINPRVAKIQFTGDGNAKKPEMKQAFDKHKLSKLVDKEPDEHAIDAFAFNMVLYNTLKVDPLFNYPLCPIKHDMHPIDNAVKQYKKGSFQF